MADRYDSVETTYLLGALPTGGSVTIQIYRVSNGAAVTGTLTATEVASSGIYRWLTSGVTWPANDIYLYRFTDGTNYTEWYSYERGLGYPETIRTALDVTIGSRAVESGGLLTTVAGYVDTEIAAIKAKTDLIPAAPASETTLATVATYVDTEVAAIKAKTDLIPAAPASETTLATVATYVDTEVAAIKAKTDLIPASPASETTVAAVKAKTDLIPAAPASETTLATVATYVDTEVAAIKAKTDLIPASPASETTVAGVKAKTDLIPAAPASETTVAAVKAKTDLIGTSSVASQADVRDLSRRYRQETVTYATVPITGRGITQAMLDDGNVISYTKVDVSLTGNFGSPDFTYYVALYYAANGGLDYAVAGTSAPSP